MIDILTIYLLFINTCIST